MATIILLFFVLVGGIFWLFNEALWQNRVL